MVIKLTIGPKIHGFKPSQELWIFGRDKVCSMTSLEGKKAMGPMSRFYGMLKIPRGMIGILIGKIQWPFLAQFLLTLLLGVYAATIAANCGG
jgi:hypothetical protein